MMIFKYLSEDEDPILIIHVLLMRKISSLDFRDAFWMVLIRLMTSLLIEVSLGLMVVALSPILILLIGCFCLLRFNLLLLCLCIIMLVPFIITNSFYNGFLSFIIYLKSPISVNGKLFSFLYIYSSRLYYFIPLTKV